MTANHALDESRMAEVIEPAVLPITLAGRVDEGQVAWAPHAIRVVPGRLHEADLERDGDVLGEADADESRRRERVAATDQRNGLARAHDLAVLEGMQGGDQF